jgi:hypothetical protein
VSAMGWGWLGFEGGGSDYHERTPGWEAFVTYHSRLLVCIYRRWNTIIRLQRGWRQQSIKSIKTDYDQSSQSKQIMIDWILSITDLIDCLRLYL